MARHPDEAPDIDLADELIFRPRGLALHAFNPQLLLVVNDKAKTLFSSPSVLLETSAGCGILMAAGERCQISSSTGAVH